MFPITGNQHPSHQSEEDKELTFEDVRKWPVTDVVEQTSQGYAQDVRLGRFEVRLLCGDRLHESSGQPGGAQRMFKPRVRGRPVDKVRRPELLDPAQPLKVLGIQKQSHDRFPQRDRPVNFVHGAEKWFGSQRSDIVPVQLVGRRSMHEVEVAIPPHEGLLQTTFLCWTFPFVVH